MKENKLEVIVVGAGPAGLGVAVLLKKLGIDFVVLEKDDVGSSFRKWPKETRFISPSFTGNFFKMTDLNAITPDTSPALSLLTEHPTGKDYVTYLEAVATFNELPIQKRVTVENVVKEGKTFTLTTNQGVYSSNFLVWAAGEFQYPMKNSFPGSDLCTHYSEVGSFADLEGDDFVVIGAYESGFDAMANLVAEGKKVTLLDDSNYLEHVESDSSYCLSPFTRDRINTVKGHYDYHSETKALEVLFENNKYVIKAEGEKTFTTSQKPINCTGFASSVFLLKKLFLFSKVGYPLLNESDESIETKNLFLVGPQVKHDNALFCFIYKYRQRFAIVAETIARRKRVSRRVLKEVLKDYKELNFYLKDLSCCDGECVC